MRILIPAGIVLLCIMFSVQSTAQSSVAVRQTLPVKSSLFQRLPQKFTVNNAAIEDMFKGPSEGKIRLALSDSIYIEGAIIERVQKNSQAICMNIRSTNFDGALLTITRITDQHGQVTFRGRMVNIRYGDILVLKKEDQQLVFAKEKQSLVVVE